MKSLIKVDLPPLPVMSDEEKLKKLKELTECLILDEDAIRRVQRVFDEEMKLGLAKNPPKKSSLQMENTFIPELPDGTEDGFFMALDLGGTNCRIILIHLKNGVEEEPLVKYYDVSEVLRLGPGVDLFDYLADCIHDFMDTNNLLHQYIPLGFTFSFPMLQKALDVGILVTWTKSFNCSGVAGQDAVKMLKDAIKKRGDLDVDVVAVLNDTTGTLVQGAYQDHQCYIGLILGTGSNACFMEKADRVEKWEEEHEGIKQVIIDVEWGAFGDNGVLDFIKTEYDHQVDLNSLLIHSFTFEKYFAGRYFGELARVILVKLTREGLLFNGIGSEKLYAIDQFTTAYISHIEEDQNEPVNTKAVLSQMDLLEFATDCDVEIVRYVCAIISIRAARLISICLAGILNHLNRSYTSIAVDGSLYKFHPKLHDLMTKYIAELAPGRKFKIMLTEDGSGKGAGMVAAIASRLNRHKKVNVISDHQG